VREMESQFVGEPGGNRDDIIAERIEAKIPRQKLKCSVPDALRVSGAALNEISIN
jgi:hypothetical protein